MVSKRHHKILLEQANKQGSKQSQVLARFTRPYVYIDLTHYSFFGDDAGLSSLVYEVVLGSLLPNGSRHGLFQEWSFDFRDSPVHGQGVIVDPAEQEEFVQELKKYEKDAREGHFYWRGKRNDDTKQNRDPKVVEEPLPWE